MNLLCCIPCIKIYICVYNYTTIGLNTLPFFFLRDMHITFGSVDVLINFFNLQEICYVFVLLDLYQSTTNHHHSYQYWMNNSIFKLCPLLLSNAHHSHEFGPVMNHELGCLPHVPNINNMANVVLHLILVKVIVSPILVVIARVGCGSNKQIFFWNKKRVKRGQNSLIFFSKITVIIFMFSLVIIL